MKKIIILTSAALLTGYTIIAINNFNSHEHRQNTIQSSNNKTIENKITDVYFEEIKEKNKQLVELTIFDSEYSTYKSTMEEDARLNPIEISISVKYKYKVALNLKHINITKSDNEIILDIPLNAVYISDNIICEPEVESDTNFFNQFKGNKIQELNNQIIKISYDNINEIIDTDYSKRKDDILNNIKYKLSNVYEIKESYLKINFVGE